MINPKAPWTPGSQLGSQVAITADAQGFAPLISARVLGDTPIHCLVTVQKERNRTDVNNQETEIVADVEWGAGDGGTHRASFDVGYSEIFTISAATLTVVARNVGVPALADAVPTVRPAAIVRASVGPGVASRPTQLRRSFGFVLAQVNIADGQSVQVPQFATAVRIHRRPMDFEAVVEQFDGSNNSIAENLVPAFETPTFNLSSGCARIRVAARDLARTFFAGRVEFLLNLG